jgi:hypothetical protein
VRVLLTLLDPAVSQLEDAVQSTLLQTALKVECQ